MSTAEHTDSAISRSPMLEPIGNRRVTNKDIAHLFDTYGLTSLDGGILLGQNESRLAPFISPRRGVMPVNNVTRSLLIRLIYDWRSKGITYTPEDYTGWPIQIPPPFKVETFRSLADEQEGRIADRWPGYKRNRMGVLIGLSGFNAIERWAKEGQEPNPVARNLMRYLLNEEKSCGSDWVTHQMARVEAEAIARGHSGTTWLVANSRWA